MSFNRATASWPAPTPLLQCRPERKARYFTGCPGLCLGQFTNINGDYSENGSYQLWNANGDKIFSVYSRKGDPAKAEGTWHTVQATGKLEGMPA